MATHEKQPDEPGFGPFFRSYTRTWVHAVATAGLTAFGTLTFVNRWFAVLALASYVVPPIVLYVRKLREHEREASTADREHEQDASADRGADTADSPASEARPGESRADLESDPDLEADAEPRPEPASEASGEPDSERKPAATEPGLESESNLESEPTRSDGDSSTGTGLEEAADDRVSEAASERNGGRDSDETARASAGDERGDGDDTENDARASWELVDVETPEATLFDIVVTESDAVYAVGAEGLVVAETGQGWTTLLEDGPAAQGNALRGVDATADGEAVWVAGDSGAVGRIDAETGRHVDHTAPADRTDNLAGVAVGGPAGDETILLINGSGEVLRGTYADGDCSWADPVTPGSGSSLADIALTGTEVGYCCDTNDGVFETTDGGESFDRIGLEGADGTLEGIATAGQGDCLVSADDGVVHRYGGSTWTPERVTDAALTGIARRGERTVVCTGDGTVHERTGAAADWKRADADVDGALHAVSIGPERAAAVGEDGLVLEQDRR